MDNQALDFSFDKLSNIANEAYLNLLNMLFNHQRKILTKFDIKRYRPSLALLSKRTLSMLGSSDDRDDRGSSEEDNEVETSLEK